MFKFDMKKKLVKYQNLTIEKLQNSFFVNNLIINL
jgi:hypothetical protein